MNNANCIGLNGRNELAQKLVQSYLDGYEEKIVLLTGMSGSGKSYVVNTVIKQLEQRHARPINAYINRGDTFVPAGRKILFPSINVVSLSIGTPMITVGAGVGWQDSNTQYQCVKKILRRGLRSNTLFCIDNLSDADSKIKLFTRLIAENITEFESEFNKKIFLLLTDMNSDSFSRHILGGPSSVEHIALEPYQENDIIAYLKKEHLSVTITEEFLKNITRIKKISAGNLRLVDFLFADLQLQRNDYFDALEKVVNYRLAKLKSSGQKSNVIEADMEDIILSSALSLGKFTPLEISEITNKDGTVVSNSLDIAKKEVFIDKDQSCFYEFHCPEIQSVLREKGINERKERLLYYYRYYTETEQDNYYFRGYYLAVFSNKLTPQAFALLCLAYTSAQRLLDYDLLNRIRELFEIYADAQKKDEFKKIVDFYDMLSQPDVNADDLYCTYCEITQLSFEFPLKGELARACFHFFYVSYSENERYLSTLLNECLQYAQNELSLSSFTNPIELKASDETIIRLAIIYEIAPYILDVKNNIDQFNDLYTLSEQFSLKSGTKRDKGLALYIRNVFNRKAFLFVNPTQCEIYYRMAKQYFSENQIWDEYCLTLICQAGTNIVIQKYKEAQDCCNSALKTAEIEGIELPQPAKIKNNLLIAQFLEFEQEPHSPQEYAVKAERISELLEQELHEVPCATEFVILTNLCSLCLYCDDDISYRRYKNSIEKLLKCTDVSDVSDENIDDFYRYYFVWFEVYRALRDRKWDTAKKLFRAIDGFVPALFKHQENFWDKKNTALHNLIVAKKVPSAFEFCNKLVVTERRETLLSKFFFRGLMLSDLQYTSYQ